MTSTQAPLRSRGIPRLPVPVFRRQVSGLLTMVVVVAFILTPSNAAAHPLGNFTVNRYARLDLTANEIRVRYVLDMAEIPTFQVFQGLDRDRDGALSPVEAEEYARTKAEDLRQNLRLVLNGELLDLKTRERRVSIGEGQGALPLLRLEVMYVASYQGEVFDATFSDGNEPSRVGWREIVVRAANGVTLDSATAPSIDITDELRRYPEDLLSAPLDRREARFSFRITPGSDPASATLTTPGIALAPIRRAQDALASLASGTDLSLGTIVFALLAAMGLGAVHALSPGHGKTVVAAYLVGSRGTVRHALFLGLTVTATHTLGVYTLGLFTLFASAAILPERLYPWLSLASGVLVITVGGNLLWARLRAALASGKRDPGEAFKAHRRQHVHDQGASHAGDHHEASLRGHSHIPAGIEGTAVSWRSLLALGISGGLLPCPSALVVMLSAIALHRIAFGLLLIVAFSVGLAGALVGIGIMLVVAGRVLTGLPSRLPFSAAVPALLLRGMPVLSALVVVLAGLVLAAQSLGQL